ncbi:MAG: hypothetical protein LC121_19575 [Anaerolineae bacterium]|nr:hypothetical protein [Anaerolineae bacterium]
MDREALVWRNRSLAQAVHAVPLKHRIRRGLLQAFAHIPLPQQRGQKNRILLIRPDHLGDVLLTTGDRALRAAHQRRNSCTVGPGQRPCYRICPIWT